MSRARYLVRFSAARIPLSLPRLLVLRRPSVVTTSTILPCPSLKQPLYPCPPNRYPHQMTGRPSSFHLRGGSTWMLPSTESLHLPVQWPRLRLAPCWVRNAIAIPGSEMSHSYHGLLQVKISAPLPLRIRICRVTFHIVVNHPICISLAKLPGRHERAPWESD